MLPVLRIASTRGCASGTLASPGGALAGGPSPRGPLAQPASNAAVTTPPQPIHNVKRRATGLAGALVPAPWAGMRVARRECETGGVDRSVKYGLPERLHRGAFVPAGVGRQLRALLVQPQAVLLTAQAAVGIGCMGT